MRWLWIAAGLGAAYLLLSGSAGTEDVPADFNMDALRQAAAQQFPNFKPDDFYLDVYGSEAELWAGDDVVTVQLLDRMPLEALRAHFNI